MDSSHPSRDGKDVEDPEAASLAPSGQEQEGSRGKKNGSSSKEMPFLLRYQATVFGIDLAIGSQALLWQQLASAPSMHFLHMPSGIPLAIWCIGVLLLFKTSMIYICKAVRWHKAVRLEFLHPIRTNFLIAPWWAALLLCLGAPGEITDRIYGPGKTIHWGVALAFSIPLLASELFLYSHWLYAYEERLGTTATAASQVAILGNFVSATAFARARWTDPALFMLTVGLIHYLVVFTTVYMRLPETQQLPRELTPLYMMFIAPPAVAAVAWSSIQGPDQFDRLSKFFAFAALALFLVLMTFVNTFFHTDFSLAWWALVFPQAATGTAYIYYANPLPYSSWDAWIVRAIAIFFWVSSSLCFVGVSCVTLWKLFKKELFPEDQVTKRLVE